MTLEGLFYTGIVKDSNNKKSLVLRLGFLEIR
jgi:hypothetical protein